MRKIRSHRLSVPTQEAEAPDLSEILMRVVQHLVEQGWPTAKITDNLRHTANVVELMHKTGGIPQ